MIKDRHFIDFISLMIVLGRYSKDYCDSTNSKIPATVAETNYFCSNFDPDAFREFCEAQLYPDSR